MRARRRRGRAWGPSAPPSSPHPGAVVWACRSSSPPARSSALETKAETRVEAARTPLSSPRLMNNLAAQGPRCRVEMLLMGRLDIYGTARSTALRSTPPPPRSRAFLPCIYPQAGRKQAEAAAACRGAAAACRSVPGPAEPTRNAAAARALCGRCERTQILSRASQDGSDEGADGRCAQDRRFCSTPTLTQGEPVFRRQDLVEALRGA